MKKRKGIFCIEGFWEQGDISDKTSVFPLLDLLQRIEQIPFIHHRCATKEEVTFMLKKWCSKGVQKKYPILYIATHGHKEMIDFGKNAVFQLGEFASLLEGKCERTVFFFGSCSTLNMRKNYIKDLLTKTNAIAALGYKNDVNWMLAASMELQALYELQYHPFDSKGIRKIIEEIKKNRELTKKLQFTIVENPIWYSRPRK